MEKGLGICKGCLVKVDKVVSDKLLVFGASDKALRGGKKDKDKEMGLGGTGFGAKVLKGKVVFAKEVEVLFLETKSLFTLEALFCLAEEGKTAHSKTVESYLPYIPWEYFHKA